MMTEQEKLDNPTGMDFLKAALKNMYPNGIPPTEEDKLTDNPEIDAKRLQKLLLKGCHHPPPERTNKTETFENANELSMEKSKIQDAEKLPGIDIFVKTEGISFFLTVKPTMTIAEIRDIILLTGEIPKNTERLTFSIALNRFGSLKEAADQLRRETK